MATTVSSDSASTRRTRAGIAVFVAVAIVVTVVSHPAPTGSGVVDLAYSIGFAICVTIGAALASVHQRRIGAGIITTALLFAALDSGSPAPLGWAVVAAFALFVAIVADDALSGAAVGACLVAALWHIAPLGATGVPSVVVAIAVGPLVFAALRRLKHDYPVLSRFALQLAAAGAAWVVVAALFTLITARPTVERAIDAAKNSAVLLDQGRLSGSVAEGSVALGHASVVRARADEWWNRGSFAVPIVAQNLRATMGLLDAGNRVMAVAEPLGNEGIAVRHSDGRVDAQGLEALAPWAVPLVRQTAAATRELTEVESVWLAPAMGKTVDEAIQVGDALAGRGPDIAGLLSVAPELLGSDMPKRYLVLFMTPVEARELEGLVGNWALLIADDGLVRVERVGRIKDLNSRATGEGFADPDSYPSRYIAYQVEQYFQNVTASPDFPTVARAAAEIFPQMGGTPIDGVVAIDPETIGALVGASGPITVQGFEEPFDSERITQFLLFDQYQQFQDLEQREILLDALTSEAFSTLLTAGINRPDRLLETLDTPIREHRLLFSTYSDPVNDALDGLGVRGEFPAPVGKADTISVRHEAAVARKLDGYIERTMSYSIESDPASQSSKISLVVTLTNTAPNGLVPYVAGKPDDYNFPDGTALAPNDHLIRLSVYTTADLVSVDVVNESPSPQVPDHYTEPEFGYNRHFLWAVVPQGESLVVTYELSSTYAPALDDPVAVRVIPQPLVNEDRWDFKADWAENGTAVESPPSRRRSRTITEPSVVILPPPGLG